MAQNLFEDQQEQLERNVERLSKVLATDVPVLPGGDGFGHGMVAALRLGPGHVWLGSGCSGTRRAQRRRGSQ